jgi:tetratricopeptide (TPR) repeat protein
VHEYAAGLDALSAGKFEETQQHLSRAVDLDPNFGMADTVMASAARNLGRYQDAEKYIKEALKHIDRMTERERYRTRAYLYLLTGDQQKCVDEYGALLQRYPSDTAGYTNIAICELHLRNVPKAVEAAGKAVAILPKRAIYHANLALAYAYAGDSQAVAKEAAEALKLGYANAYLHQAYASLLQDQPAPAAEAYHNLEKVNPSDAATALADLAVYEGRFSDAVGILEKGAAADMAERKPDPDAAATKFWALANVQLLRGEKGPALAAAKRALDLSKAFQTRFVAAQVYVAAGDAAKAHELAAGLSSELEIEPQAYGKLIEGEAALKKGDGRGAVKIFTDANNLLDTWIGRFDLGRAYLAIGAFPEADSEFDRCIKRRGEALVLFLDLPTYGYFPPVYYYQGRAREGMKSVGFAESYKKYLSIRGKAGEDPLLAEIRRRVPQ